ncbi:hypothetical protein EPI10_004402 [Gossypium australe]|uniref:Uncharacterized protein n=1 Tax=Gossypium australe TaxID=47621 RepID=A0A5B6WL91_9ROSI|nr:hypothetical protein EPI10_004402 [Gossypium australe]
MKTTDIFNMDVVSMLANQVEALGKKINVFNVSKQCDANGVGMINSEYSPFESSMMHGQVNFMDIKITPITIVIIQVRGTIQISLGVIKIIKGHNSLRTALKNHQASIQGLENQIGQLAKLVSERSQDSLPTNTETNPNEQIHAIIIRNVEGLVEPEKKSKLEAVVKSDKVEESKKEHKSMPKYVKFLMELLTNKKKLENLSNVELNAVCSCILQNKLANKLENLGSFTIPCLIGSLNASINVMPYKIFKQLGLEEPKPTRMSIQLTNSLTR